MAQMLPGNARYSVTVISGVNVLALPDVPDKSWPVAQKLVRERDITRVFESFMEELRGDRGKVQEGPLTFIPIDWPGRVKVYFDPRDTNSLHYVVADRETADDYAASIGLDKPFYVSKYDRRDRDRHF